ncbi:MAG: 3-hydroxyacyl-CoA dehydrogenase family protein [Chitinophagaceae bacterium]
MKEQFKTDDLTIGVVGLGLMGSSIVVSLLITGHRVIGVAPISGEKEIALPRIKKLLAQCEEASLLEASIGFYLSFLTISDDYNLLEHCELVMECVIEKIEVKEVVYKKITSVTYPDTIIGTNTSAIPISLLQRDISFPERFIGIHWAEPAFATRFMEITRGDQTSPKTTKIVYGLACQWGKEPTLLRKDIKGFITNRLMYAVYRETFAIVEEGTASMEEVDKAFRYDVGSWMMLMGIFRRLDFLGLEDFLIIYRNIFPKLNNSGKVPAIMQKLVAMKATGIQSRKGLYDYTTEEAGEWEKAFGEFNREIFQLAMSFASEKEVSSSNTKNGDVS